MREIVAVLEYVGFIVAAWGTIWFGSAMHPTARRKLVVTGFIVFTMGVTFGNVVIQKNLWPFSTWHLMHIPFPVRHDETWPRWRVVGVAPDGKEHLVDHRSFEPLNANELGAWARTHADDYSPESIRRVGAHLLDQINAGRARVAAGKSPGTNRRFLGPFTASAMMLLPRTWSDSGDVPPEPFVGMRWYREYWALEEILLDPERVTLDLIFEYIETP